MRNNTREKFWNKMRNKIRGKKSSRGWRGQRGQMKIQQTAFMLLALAFFFSLVFIFYINFSRQKVYDVRNELAMQEAYSLLQKYASNPEFSCIESRAYCLDEGKLLALANVSNKYKDYFSGINSLYVREIYPGNKTIIVYENIRGIKEGESIQGYSAFIPLCKTKFRDNYEYQECKLAKFVVSTIIKKV